MSLEHPDAVPAKTIVVAVDGSPPSREAGRFAVQLAKELRARLHVTHIIDPDSALIAAGGAGAAWTAAVPALRAQATEIVGLTVREAERERVAHSVAIVEGYDVAHGVLREADRERAALVIVGSHGRTGLRRAILGSVAERVVRTSHRPVLVYRRPPPPRPAKRSATRAGRSKPAPG